VGANLFVQGIPWQCSGSKAAWAAGKRELRTLFEPHGQIVSIRSNKVNPNKVGRRARQSRRRRDCAGGGSTSCYVSYTTPMAARDAIAAVSGQLFLGSALTVTMSRDQGLNLQPGYLDVGCGQEVAQASSADDDAAHHLSSAAAALPAEFADRASRDVAERQRQKEAALAGSGVVRCTMCGEEGHFAQGCPLLTSSVAPPSGGDRPMPQTLAHTNKAILPEQPNEGAASAAAWAVAAYACTT
jgi:hypothetical protein